MYTRDFWDSVYKLHFDDAPWMSHEWASHGIGLISKYIDISPENLILDYGCGNALISDHFYTKGAKVELAEISEEMIKWLKIRYENKMNIYNVKLPNEIKFKNRYDYIIAWGVFHHIKPDLWEVFMNGFHRLMKQDALLFISGWNEEDEVIIQDNKTARFTGQPVWFINNLINIVDRDKFEVVENNVSKVHLSAFDKLRSVRNIILRKK